MHGRQALYFPRRESAPLFCVSSSAMDELDVLVSACATRIRVWAGACTCSPAACFGGPVTVMARSAVGHSQAHNPQVSAGRHIKCTASASLPVAQKESLM